MEGLLSIRGVTKSFGDVEVLHDINIEVSKGEFLVLVGPSGCGKSTLLSMIAGLEKTTAGEISIRGQMMNDVHPSQRNIAMVFQTYALYPNMTVAGNITFGLEMHGVPQAERDKALGEVASMLQIEKLLDRKPAQLSGGQRQRVAMGRALVRDPAVFLFDEPLSNLDAKLRVDMRTEIKKLHQNLGTTIVYVTHDQIEAMTLSTRIAVMHDGHIQQLGTPKEIYDRPSNLFVATFMGSPSMNLIEAEISQGPDGLAAVIGSGDGRVALGMNGSHGGLASHAGARLLMGVRPEAISGAGGAEAAANVSTFEGRVAVVEPAGSDTYVATELGGKECTARMEADYDLKPGDACTFAVNMDKVVFFDPDTERRVETQQA